MMDLECGCCFELAALVCTLFGFFLISQGNKDNSADLHTFGILFFVGAGVFACCGIYHCLPEKYTRCAEQSSETAENSSPAV